MLLHKLFAILDANAHLAFHRFWQKDDTRNPISGQCFRGRRARSHISDDDFAWRFWRRRLPSAFFVFCANTGALLEPIRYGRDTALVEMPISWSLDDYPVFEHMRLPNSIQTGLMNARLVYDNWPADFTYLADNYDWRVPTPFTHMSSADYRLLMLERLIQALRDKGSIFLTMEAAVEEYGRHYPGSRSERPDGAT